MRYEKILNMAIEHYGKDNQLFVLVEEVSELLKEVSKFRRGANNKQELIEEIADVEVMLQQLIIIADLEETEILSLINNKKNRLKARITMEQLLAREKENWKNDI